MFDFPFLSVKVRKKRFVAKHKTEHVSENQAHKIVTRETREKKKIVARHAPNPGRFLYYYHNFSVIWDTF